ncbi:SDR family oxidoreductase [Aetokthonos hydrillicola Thurmond2011]|jgi:NAD(P)-dependent dehydrogenase (short-subunit alcohol dehydrogenase family)|uniref:SDR family oxidoreductase n=1 Tax=Aetokthonos hydrillicola Thurmond2011 TaxID=2712845 RepID=A0AAP5MC83_9CYAN|nr:SDR family oxidoreductase [Aetokthonos hydrillicola]MBW4583912.1 SDR family oxidoreductase [Aetokthonos hydrillicola CCALA 1050]MDR9898892.1 SDR family oxidoreductase [Aetokthonos hydrillicola Thurmond2011]
MQLKPIDQQVVAVVGASSGIGRDAALKFARRGAKVAVAARNQSKLASLVDEIRGFGGEATAIAADVSLFEQVKAIADRTVEVYGRIDTWVHVAAVGIFATFDNTTPEEFKHLIDVNLMGQVYGAMAALPHLKREGRGALIHVSSMEGRRSLPYQSAYSSAKHGIEGFVEAMRLELQHERIPISVTSVKPAVINTPFWNNGLSKLGVKPAGIPPYYDPRLVAEAILYVAEHPTRDFLVGDVARVLDILQRLSPELMDAALLAVGFQGLRSKEPKSPDDSNNFYEPVLEDTRIDGDFSNLVIPSITDLLARNPAFQWGAKAFGLATITAGVAALAFLATQAFNNEG